MLFSYTGFDQYRIKKKGYITAENRREAIKALKTEGIVAIMSLDRAVDFEPINKLRIEIMKIREKRWKKEKEEKKAKQVKKKLDLKQVMTALTSDIKNLFSKDESVEKISKEKFQHFKNLFEQMEEAEDLNEFKEVRNKKQELSRSNIVLSNNKYDRRLNWEKIENIDEEHLLKSEKLKIKDKEMLTFMRRFKTMRETGVPILRALSLLQNGASEDMIYLLKTVKSDVENGETLAFAFGKFPNQISTLHLSLIDIGEEAGELEVTLEHIINDMERTIDIKSKLKNASIYPSIVISFVSFLLVLGSIFLIPKMENLFLELSDGTAELPLITRIVFTIGKGIPYVAMFTVLFFILFKKFGTKVPGLKTWIENTKSKLKLKTPIVAPVIQTSYMFTMASTLSIMMASNIRNSEALRLAKNSINNTIIQNELEDALFLIEHKSLPLHESLQEQEHIDSILISMAETGYETGELQTSLEQAADLYLKELDVCIADLTEAIGPILIILLALIVVPVIFALYMLLFGMQDLIA